MSTLSVTSKASLIMVPVEDLSLISVTGYNGISPSHNLYKFTNVSRMAPFSYLKQI